MQNRYKVGIMTLGCKVNLYESEALSERLAELGADAVPADGHCDGYIVNTCTVTAEADRKSRQMIRRLHQRDPYAPIVVTGCTAQTSPEQLSQIDGVVAVCGNAEKLRCADLIMDALTSVLPDSPLVSVPSLDGAEFEKMSLTAFPRTRVYVKIEDGCENRCSYCAIPGARGPVRSKDPDDVIAEIIGFCRAGCREIVLTGIETASYGRDLDGVTLGGLLRKVDSVCGDCRIRLGSLDPSLFRQSFVDEIRGLSSLAPHFHISLQSGSSHILAGMRRKYNADGARAAMDRIRETIPGVLFTTDVIVGFPGETEEDFEETKRFLADAKFLNAHIFPYSRRRGTPAAAFPDQVPEDIKHRRAAELSTIQHGIRLDLLNSIIASGSTHEVLFETFDEGRAVGHSASFLEVSVPSAQNLHGKTFPVRLTSTDGGLVFGEIVE